MWVLPKTGYPPNHPDMDHFDIETRWLSLGSRMLVAEAGAIPHDGTNQGEGFAD